MFDVLSNALASGRFHQIVTANALLLLEAENNRALNDACAAASLVVPESAGIFWALKHLDHPAPYKISGVDLAFRLCEEAAKSGQSVFLLGGQPGVSESAARFLLSKISNMKLAGTLDGFFDPQQDTLIVNAIKESRPAVVLVALGMPFQDIWIHTRKNRLPGAIFMGVGGTFDVWAGRVKRAPLWFQRNGLEWLYRLCREPHRWRRMTRLPVFAFKVWRQGQTAVYRRKI